MTEDRSKKPETGPTETKKPAKILDSKKVLPNSKYESKAHSSHFV